MKIENPAQTTYFICREDETYTVTAYGSVGTDRVMETSQPIVDTYLDESVWLAKLLEDGIEPNSEQQL